MNESECQIKTRCLSGKSDDTQEPVRKIAGFMLPQEALIEFAEIYRQEYGIALSVDEVSLRAHAFINLYRAVHNNLEQ